jgi:hypothetical protein
MVVVDGVSNDENACDRAKDDGTFPRAGRRAVVVKD